MRDAIFFLDFEDSYSYNIVADISNFSSFHLEVINLQEHENFLQLLPIDKPLKLILGPGPDDPKSYPVQLNFLKKIFLQNSSIKLLGICLGHQMILKALGYTIKKSQNPLHGISIQLPLNTWWKKYFSTHQDFLEVQRYNSLAVTANTYKKVSKNFLLVDNEIMLFAMEKILSMQFHPESIGTIHKEIIFRRINHFFKS